MALIDKASLLFVPSVVAEGKAFNILPSGNRAPDSTDQNSGYDQTRADFDFDRGSNTAATRIGSDGLIKKYRENKLLQSEAFSASWSAFSATATTGQSGYDGTTNALLLTSTGNYARIQQAASGTGIMTASCYMKAGTTSWAMIRVAGSGYNITQYFDLENGVIGSLSGVSASINLVSDSWYRCEVVVNVLATPTFYIYTALADGNLSVTNETITIQSPQFESGLVATTFIPTTSVTGKAGVLVDLPRINYDANGENGSLLLEPSRQQLIQYSEYFSGWNNIQCTLTQNYGVSPDGSNNSTRCVFSSSNRALEYLVSSSAATASIYIKGTNGETIQFGTNGAEQLFTLNGDWQRIEKYNAGSFVRVTLNTYAGTARDFEIYGAQLEPNATYASSYIPNHGESGGVTRAADYNVCSSSAVIGQSEGTAFIEFEINRTISGTTRAITISNGGGNERIGISLSTSVIYGFIVDGGTTQAEITKSTTPSGRYKAALAYKANDVAFYLNGEQVGTDNAATMPTTNEVELGSQFGASELGGGVKQAALFKERLSNAELATLTTL